MVMYGSIRSKYLQNLETNPYEFSFTILIGVTSNPVVIMPDERKILGKETDRTTGPQREGKDETSGTPGLRNGLWKSSQSQRTTRKPFPTTYPSGG